MNKHRRDLYRVAAKRGITNIDGITALYYAVVNGIAWRYRRNSKDAFCYEFELPGWGKKANKSKWRDVSRWGKIEL